MYQLKLEMLAVESAPDGVLDVDRQIPYAVVWETMGTLGHLTPNKEDYERN